MGRAEEDAGLAGKEGKGGVGEEARAEREEERSEERCESSGEAHQIFLLETVLVSMGFILKSQETMSRKICHWSFISAAQALKTPRTYKGYGKGLPNAFLHLRLPPS